MIQSFRHRGLRRLYDQGDRAGIGPAMLAKVEEILLLLDSAESVEEIDLPGYRLHRLAGKLRGSYSVRVTGNWRITFRFEQGSVFDVDLVDYH